jgi:hypothetical protein
MCKFDNNHLFLTDFSYIAMCHLVAKSTPLPVLKILKESIEKKDMNRETKEKLFIVLVHLLINHQPINEACDEIMDKFSRKCLYSKIFHL